MVQETLTLEKQQESEKERKAPLLHQEIGLENCLSRLLSATWDERDDAMSSILGENII
jgi:hypothetical protein